MMSKGTDMDLLDFIGYAFTAVIVLILCAALEAYVDGGE